MYDSDAANLIPSESAKNIAYVSKTINLAKGDPQLTSLKLLNQQLAPFGPGVKDKR